MKVFINCCKLTQILCLTKFWFLDVSQNALGQRDGFLNQLYFQKKMMKNSDFLYFDTNTLKLKVD